MIIDKTTYQMRLNNWAALINECNSSNMTKKEWCVANNINEKQLYYWQRRVRMQLVQNLDTATLAPKFVEVPVQTETIPTKVEQESIHLTQTNSDAVLHIKDFTLEINNTISPGLLSLLIEAITHA